MTNVNCFPVIDADSDNRQQCSYLEEIVPHSFRLHSKESVPKTVSISCPYCGMPLQCLYEGDGNRILSMYRCPKCG